MGLYKKGVMTEGPAWQKGAIKEGKIVHPYQKILGSQGKASPRRDLQKETLPQSALKWGLREVQPGSTPSSCTGDLHLCSQGWPGSFPRWSVRLGLNGSHIIPKELSMDLRPHGPIILFLDQSLIFQRCNFNWIVLSTLNLITYSWIKGKIWNSLKTQSHFWDWTWSSSRRGQLLARARAGERSRDPSSMHTSTLRAFVSLQARKGHSPVQNNLLNLN